MRLRRPVQEILASLDDRRPLVGRAAWERETVARLAALAACGEAVAVTSIGRFLRSPSDAVMRAAVHAIHVLLWEVVPEALAELDREARVGWLTRDELVQGDVARLAALGDGAPGLAAFASLHRSGYVRAEGVGALRNVEEAPAVGYLLLRANDWVEAVRRLALAAVRERLVPANATTFLRHGPLIVARAKEGRARGDGLCDDVACLLARPECREAVAYAMHDGSVRTRRAAQWLVNRASGDDEGFAELALAADDAGLRLGALLRWRDRQQRHVRVEDAADAESGRERPSRRPPGWQFRHVLSMRDGRGGQHRDQCDHVSQGPPGFHLHSRLHGQGTMIVSPACM